MRFGGIRKPRLGNTDLLNMARSRGWILSQSAGGSGGARNLNYTMDAGMEYFILFCSCPSFFGLFCFFVRFFVRFVFVYFYFLLFLKW